MAKNEKRIGLEVRARLMAEFNHQERTSAKEAKKTGKELRRQVPLDAHRAWSPCPARPDPVALLREQGASRIQALLPLRYERMSASPFAFYRGAALIMASDLAGTPSTGIRVQACGDAHIANFGLFNSPERRTVFDINDFDETAPGPWEWDIKRLVASVEICGRNNRFKKRECRDAVLACGRGYREAMNVFSTMGNLEVWYAHLDVDSLLSWAHQNASSLSKKEMKHADRIMRKVKGKNSTQAARKLTEVVDGNLRVASNPPLVVPIRSMVADALAKGSPSSFDEAAFERFLRSVFDEYRSSLPESCRLLLDTYTVVDVARKVVGVGSVGTRAWIVVLCGADAEDPLVLQVKEAQESVLERFCGKSQYNQRGQRVVEGQRAMQTTSDMFLGWCSATVENGRTDYYVRQLWDGKGSIDLAAINPEQLATLAGACGWTLAHAHARTGDRFSIAGYLGSSDEFDHALAQFAEAYADQNDTDYARFMEALRSGALLAPPQPSEQQPVG